MTSRKDAARAIAYFESTDDIYLLHQLTGEIAPRVKRMVGKMLAKSPEEAIPPPADLYPASEVANRDEAVDIVRKTDDFPLLQALARAIGRRIEAIEIVASAEFPEGTRVSVPENVAFPPSGPHVGGTVRETGTRLTVQLDNGERWQGPPSLATREAN